MSDHGTLLDLTLTDDGLRLAGEIDAASSVALAAELDPLPTGHRIVLDLAAVTFIDSSGLRVLIDAHRRAETEGRLLVIANPSPPVSRLFEISGLTNHLHVEQ
jgi:anti-sigma B factor antagonist